MDTQEQDRMAERLAHAADGVVVGAVPLDALMRGGRRRRVRRALLSGALALAVLVPLGGVAVSLAREDRPAEVAVPQPPEEDSVTADLGSVDAAGVLFHAKITVQRFPIRFVKRPASLPPDWEVPKEGPWPWVDVDFDGPPLREPRIFSYGPSDVEADQTGVLIQSHRVDLDRPGDAMERFRTLAVGQIKPEFRRVVITWKDGSTSEPRLQSVPKSDRLWFIAGAKAWVKPDFVDLYDASGKHTRQELPQ
ncbi:hypothetical protein [Streptomyces sp. NPDC089799]|uniref:hypothetical protein n=1 Tax=Streptomyces sp. NPDC089799 TaxID=3155066 RepID=UPI0034162CA2